MIKSKIELCLLWLGEKMPICISLIFFYIIVFNNANSVLAHLCGEGWSHIGDACLRINSSRESYDNAKLYCYNLSGNLASLTTSKEVEFVLDEIQKYTLQVT